MKNSDKCLETKQITKNSPVPVVELQFVDGLSHKSASGRTEPNLSREVPCQVVHQEFTDFSHMVPVWDCKLTKQMKLQEAAILKVGNFKINLLLVSYLSVLCLAKKIGKIKEKFIVLLKLIT